VSSCRRRSAEQAKDFTRRNVQRHTFERLDFSPCAAPEALSFFRDIDLAQVANPDDRPCLYADCSLMRRVLQQEIAIVNQADDERHYGSDENRLAECPAARS